MPAKRRPKKKQVGGGLLGLLSGLLGGRKRVAPKRRTIRKPQRGGNMNIQSGFSSRTPLVPFYNMKTTLAPVTW